jgi:hypothetical protein
MMPAVAFDGTNYLATWTDFRHNPDQPAVYAARVNQSGTVLDPNGFKVVEEPGGQGWPPAAFDGTNYLVTWIEGRNGEDDIYAARVTPAGVVLDSGGFPVSRATGSQWHPQVDFDGTNYFVVWRDMRSGMFDGVYGARVRPDGTVLDTGGLWLSGEYSFSVMPQVRYDGVNLAVVWQDFDVNTYVTNVRGCHVSPDGMVVDTFSVEDLQSFDFMGWLSLAAGDQRQLLATWYDMVGEYQGKSYYNYRALAEVGAFGVGITAPHATEPRLRLAVYPSPCRGRVTIEAAIPNGRSQTRLEVFTSDGRAVRSLALPQPTGSVTWDGTDDAGRAQPAGVYVIRMSGGQMTANRKLLLLR